jgi:hypothetical protein
MHQKGKFDTVAGGKQMGLLRIMLLAEPRPATTLRDPGTHRAEGSGTLRERVGVILARRGSLACRERRVGKDILHLKAGTRPCQLTPPT